MRSATLCLCAAAASTLAGSAQNAEQTFDVASVRLNRTGDGNGPLRQLPGGRMTPTNMLRAMITFAYSLVGYQLIGGPGWLNTNRYDVAAKMDGNPIDGVEQATDD